MFISSFLTFNSGNRFNSRWCSGFCNLRSLGEFRPLRILQIIIKKLSLLFHFLNVFSKFVENMLSDKFWGFEFLSAEWTEPLVFINFLAVGGYKLFYLIRFSFKS